MTVGISVQVKTVNSWSMSPSVQSTSENRLRDSILKEKEKYENTYEELQKVLAELETARANVANSSSSAKKIEARISEINKLLGYTDIKGKGIVILLQDGTPDSYQEEAGDDYVAYMSTYMVHDGDLKAVVNELFNAGAEAVSINGERIVSVSSIKCSGNIIKVNNQKLGSPFEIKAIGSPDKLYGALKRPAGYLENIELDGVIVNIKKEDKIRIKKYTGVYSADYMKRVD